MSDSFNRLLRLAQKTKSTLVAYDKTGDEHFVVMGIDDFESLHDKKQIDPVVPPIDPNQIDPGDFDCEEDPEPEVEDDVASDAAILDQLNHDIATWRTRREQEEQSNKIENITSDEMDNTSDEVEPDVANPIKIEESEADTEATPVNNLTDKPRAVTRSSWTPLGQVLAKAYPNLKPQPSTEINYDPITDARNPILPTTSLEDEPAGVEEPLEDDPIFLEEPVE